MGKQLSEYKKRKNLEKREQIDKKEASTIWDLYQLWMEELTSATIDFTSSPLDAGKFHAAGNFLSNIALFFARGGNLPKEFDHFDNESLQRSNVWVVMNELIDNPKFGKPSLPDVIDAFEAAIRYWRDDYSSETFSRYVNEYDLRDQKRLLAFSYAWAKIDFESFCEEQGFDPDKLPDGILFKHSNYYKKLTDEDKKLV